MITIDELHDLIVREYERAGFGAAAEAVHALIATRLRHARCNAGGLGHPGDTEPRGECPLRPYDAPPEWPPDADGCLGENRRR